jgi:hypothetical protein
MRDSGDRDVLIESITKRVLDELLGISETPGAPCSCLDLEGRVALAQACIACKLYFREAAQCRSAIPTAPVAGGEPDTDEEMERCLETAVAYAQEAAELIRGTETEGEEPLSVGQYVTAAEQAIEDDRAGDAIDYLDQFCQQAKSWWHEGNL